MSEVLQKFDPQGLPLREKSDYMEVRAGVQVANVDEAITLAKTFAQSGMFKDVETAAKAVVKILMGAEFGISPVAAMNGIHIVQGKMMMSGVMIGTLIKRSKNYRFRVLEATQDVCRIEFKELLDGEWEVSGIEEFTRADATRQGTQNMQKFGKNMLFNRAMSNGAKMYCPDIFGGQPIYAEGEIEELPVATEKPKSTASAIKDRLRKQEEAITVHAEPEKDEAFRFLVSDFGLGEVASAFVGSYDETVDEIRAVLGAIHAKNIDVNALIEEKKPLVLDDLREYAGNGQDGLF